MQKGAPVLAYLDRDYIKWLKSCCFRVYVPPFLGASNEPVRRLQELRSKRLVPENRDHDPFLVGAMVSLAQVSAYSGPSLIRSQFQARDVVVRLISLCPEAEAFIVYTGRVPKGLLEMLHDNEKAPSTDVKIDIDYQYIPVGPEFLKERLGQALGVEVVGDVTSPAQASPVPTPPSSKKRKREILSPVNPNVSFSENRSPGLPVSPSAKRSKMKVGVVS